MPNFWGVHWADGVEDYYKSTKEKILWVGEGHTGPAGLAAAAAAAVTVDVFAAGSAAKVAPRP